MRKASEHVLCMRHECEPICLRSGTSEIIMSNLVSLKGIGYVCAFAGEKNSTMSYGPDIDGIIGFILIFHGGENDRKVTRDQFYVS